MNHDEFEYLAHIIISDGQIDDRESQLLDSIMQQSEATEDAYQHVQAVYADHEKKRTFDELINSIGSHYDDQARREIVGMGVMIALVDDYLDPAEEQVLELSLQRWGVSTEEYEKLKRDIRAKLAAEKSSLRADEQEETVHPFF